MDKYEELIKVFSDILKESQDYHIAHIYHAGYVSVVGEIGVTKQRNVFYRWNIRHTWKNGGEPAKKLEMAMVLQTQAGYRKEGL